MDWPDGWVRVEFYGRAPAGEVVTGADLAEIRASLMGAFGFTRIDGLAVAASTGPVNRTETEPCPYCGTRIELPVAVTPSDDGKREQTSISLLPIADHMHRWHPEKHWSAGSVTYVDDPVAVPVSVLEALASAWEDQADHEGRESVRTCARMLRDAITHGGQG